MDTKEYTTNKWIDIVHHLGELFALRAEQYDKDGAFVFENYEELKANQFFSAAIPVELGGSGVSQTEMSDIIREMAYYCSSTALAFSMHQHLIAAAVWKFRHTGQGADMLRNVAKHQFVLVSTGARDWLQSNGEMIKTNGGYLLTSKKHFASQSIGGDIAVTSAPYTDEEGQEHVLHFSVPLKSVGISILDDWDVMGMRATGSQTISFDKVFISESSIALQRPRDEFHPVWNLVLSVALPLIMSAYVGIAEKASEIAIRIGKKYARNQKHLPYLIGKTNNSLISSQTQLKAMNSMVNNLDFQPSEATTVDMLSLKTNVGEAAKGVVAQAMETIGGQSFYRKNTLERLFRDVQASPFHPLPKWDQYAFTGEKILNSSK